MTNPPSPNASNLYLRRAERDLGALVIAIEFTMISVMAGMVLFLLADNATPLLRDLRAEYWPYILACLLMILWVWTEVIGHALTFVGWPIDIGHNLLYIIGALTLGIQEHFLDDPRGFFAMLVVLSASNASVMYYDFTLLQKLSAQTQGAAADLYAAALSRQRALLQAVPPNMAFAVVSAASIYLFPDALLGQRWHLLPIILFCGWMVFLLVRGMRGFSLLRSKILFKSAESLVGARVASPPEIVRSAEVSPAPAE